MHEFELDPNFGLHSYTVYVNIRNQTKTSFVSLCKKIFHADLTVTKEKKFLRLNVVDSDMVNEVGFKLSMLPKFSWSSESFSKNSIDLFALVDLCLFDSNMDIVFSEWFETYLFCVLQKMKSSEVLCFYLVFLLMLN